MPYYRDYRGHEIHLDESRHQHGASNASVTWRVIRRRSELSSGLAASRPSAYNAACAKIDEIADDPYRYPVNLVGYPKELEGDVITNEGVVLGRWRMAEDDALEFVDFIPEGSQEVLFSEHFVGLLCSQIRDWNESKDL